MKKIIYTLLVAVLALSFMGCPSVYKDLEAVGSLDGIYLRGGMNSWTTDNPLVAGESVGLYSVEFEAKEATYEFKFADEGWGVEYCQAKGNTTLTTALAGITFSSVGNDKVEGLTVGKTYKFDIIAYPTSIAATLVEVVVEEPAVVSTYLTVTLPDAASEANVYAWSSDGSDTDLFGSWPGVPLTRAGKSNVFYTVIDWDTLKTAIPETSSINLIINGVGFDQSNDINVTYAKMTGDLTLTVNADKTFEIK